MKELAVWWYAGIMFSNALNQSATLGVLAACYIARGAAQLTVGALKDVPDPIFQLDMKHCGTGVVTGHTDTQLLRHNVKANVLVCNKRRGSLHFKFQFRVRLRCLTCSVLLVSMPRSGISRLTSGREVASSGILTSSMFTSGTLTSGSLMPSVLTSGILTSGTLTSGILTSGTLTESMLASGTLTSGTLTSGTLTFASGTLTLASGILTSGIFTSGILKSGFLKELKGLDGGAGAGLGRVMAS